MKGIITAIKRINPFSGEEDGPAALYVIRKLLAFFLIYMGAVVLQQVILVGMFWIGGYDPIQGILPSEEVQQTALFYSFAANVLLTVLYCKKIEKRSWSMLGFGGRFRDCFLGMGAAVFMLLLIIGSIWAAGGISYQGISEKTDYILITALLVGFLIQGTAEELMCRGFLMQSLSRKVSVPAAVFWSATAFALPHVSGLFVVEVKYRVIGILNLYLISMLFSLLMICKKNIWIACGFHSLWNFLLYGVIGLQLSGNEAAEGIFCFEPDKDSIINGGAYGVEASVVTTIVLSLAVFLLWAVQKKKEEQGDGI